LGCGLFFHIVNILRLEQCDHAPATAAAKGHLDWRARMPDQGPL
jgi:hypothetical protein